MLETLKILFCIPFLLYACYSDIKKRSVSNNVWLTMLVGSIFFFSYDYSIYKISSLHPLFISAVFMFLLVYILFKIGAFGGADAKSLIVLSMIFPAYPAFHAFGYALPLHKPLYDIFALSILGNSALLTIVVPIGLAIFNITKMGWHIDNPVYIFMGYKTKISKLADRHIRLIQDFEVVENRVQSRFKWGGVEINEKKIRELNGLLEKGLIKDEVWVTPGLPFMISITLGFFTAAFYGDLIFALIKFLL
ncbi:Preflagellin peptidase [uncultured archaeon]|nr:Preflagellin peptidase [uncultured archaeon]